MNQTKGWRNHPQLIRFKGHEDPSSAIGFYLVKIHEEAVKRGYNYNKLKIMIKSEAVNQIDITTGQLQYEYNLLLERLKTRDKKRYNRLVNEHVQEPKPHPLFVAIQGNVEPWEKSRDANSPL